MPNVFRSPVRLKFLPAPDRLDFAFPDGHIVLLTDDGSPTTSLLAQSLSERGRKAVILSFPQLISPSLPTQIERVILPGLSEEDLKNQLTAIANRYGPIGTFIHLHPHSASRSDGIDFPEAEAAIIKQVFFMAKHLKEPLNQAASMGRSCFLTVARLDGEFGLSQTSFSPLGAGLFGLTKTLRHEWKPVFCRALDLSPALNEKQSAQRIIAELYDPDRCLSEVGYSPQRRTTLTVEGSLE